MSGGSVTNVVEAGDEVARWKARADNLACFLVGTTYWTTHRIHYDADLARAEGYDDVVVPGVLLYSWFEREIVRWAGSPDAIVAYSFRHTGLPTVADELDFVVTVASVGEPGVDGHVELTLDLEARAVDARPIVAGTCTVRAANPATVGR